MIEMHSKPNRFLPPRQFIGHAVLNGVEDTFQFEVSPRADEEDVESAMLEAFFESGLVDIWCEEVKE